MEYSPSRTTDREHGQPRQESKMSMLVMAQPVPHSAFKREFAWDESRHSDYASTRRPSDNERIALPSIRQVQPSLACPHQKRLLVTDSQLGDPRASTPDSAPGTCPKDAFICSLPGWRVRMQFTANTRLHPLAESEQAEAAVDRR